MVSRFKIIIKKKCRGVCPDKNKDEKDATRKCTTKACSTNRGQLNLLDYPKVHFKMKKKEK